MQLKKFFIIASKDIQLILRDRTALLLMLLAPFVLTLGLGAVSGRFSGDSSTGVSNIPVVIVNEDSGELGKALIEVFQSTELVDLVAPTILDDFEEARKLVDENQSAAAIFIPEGFTGSIIPSTGQVPENDVVQIEFYANPTSPTSAGVLRSILDEFVNQVEVGRISGEVIVRQLIEDGLISIDQAAMVGSEIGQEMALSQGVQSSITVRNETAAEGETLEFDVLGYMAPGMAVMFLMFTVTYGAQSLLNENRRGTLSRLLVAPTLPGYVLGGKAFGIFLKGFAQLVILISGTSLLFHLQWGDLAGVILLILAAAFAATGWGMFFAAILKTPGQIAITGTAVMLLFGILSGTFINLNLLPDWISVVNKVTPNAWVVDGFYILSVGGKLDSVLPHLLGLTVMGFVLFIIASAIIGKRGLAVK